MAARSRSFRIGGLAGPPFGAAFGWAGCEIRNDAHGCPPEKSAKYKFPESCFLSAHDTVTLLSLQPGLKSKVNHESLHSALAFPLPLASRALALIQYLFVEAACVEVNCQPAVPLPSA